MASGRQGAAVVADGWSGGEAKVTAKMDQQYASEARGGLGVAGDAPERAHGGERRPAMEVKRGRRRRVK